jgi:hypothetical protein
MTEVYIQAIGPMAYIGGWTVVSMQNDWKTVVELIMSNCSRAVRIRRLFVDQLFCS